jgi:ribosomal protein S12 methylthiotransferase accessory factor
MWHGFCTLLGRRGGGSSAEERNMDMTITFPGGAKVDAECGEFVIKTDQPVAGGGDGSAPAPFDYFLASIGTCAGIYVLNFLTQRQIPTRDVHLCLSAVRDPDSRALSEVTIKAVVPAGFPAKYERALVAAMNLCSVKKSILDPPRFKTVVATADPTPAQVA